jgi:GGDEF domain-containing protein
MSTLPVVGNGPFAVTDIETLDLVGEGLGCVAVRVISSTTAAEVDRVVRELCHLTARVTRPEDLVLRTASDTVVLFAHVHTLAGVKAIAERVTARGRREICEEFRVGIALGGPGDTATTLLQQAQMSDYTSKPRMRGQAMVVRSGAA